jgi:hypothetical protein
LYGQIVGSNRERARGRRGGMAWRNRLEETGEVNRGEEGERGGDRRVCLHVTLPSCVHFLPSMPYGGQVMPHLMCDIVAGLTIEQTVDGQTVTYAENAEIPITDVGDSTAGGGSLVCRTDRTDCCTGIGQGEIREGEWLYPDNTTVGTSASGDDIFRNRGTSIVKLNRRNNAIQPTGLYCCVVGSIANPDARICVTLSKYAARLYNNK